MCTCKQRAGRQAGRESSDTFKSEKPRYGSVGEKEKRGKETDLLPGAVSSHRIAHKTERASEGPSTVVAVVLVARRPYVDYVRRRRRKRKKEKK